MVKFVRIKNPEREKLRAKGIKEYDCWDCGDIFPIDDLDYSRYDTILICENCYETRNEEDEEWN